MIEIDNNTYTMPSHLDASTVSTILKKYTKHALPNSAWMLDFSKCIKVNSAGLAMIIELIKHAKKNDIDLELNNLSNDTISLAKVNGVEEIISKHITK